MAGKKVDRPVDYGGREMGSAPGKGGVPGVITWMVCAYLLMMPIAEVALRASVDMTRDRSRFAIVNAITLTGFQSTIATNNYPVGGRIVVFTLTILGMLFAMIVGGMAVVRILRLPYGDGQVARGAGWVCGVLMVVGAIPLIAAGQEPMEAFMLSASALGNSGQYFGKLPGLGSWQTYWVVLPLSVVGGLGLPVLMEMWDVAKGRRGLSVHGRVVVVMTAGLYLGVFVLCFLLQWLDAGTGLGWREVIGLAGSSSVGAVNSRTAGFPFQFVQDMPRGMQWIVILAMMIGGNSAGTAGGLKTTTVAELVRGVGGALRGKGVGRSFAVAATWLWVYVGMAVVVLMLLLATVPQVAADRLLFEAVSALSNVGLSHEVIMIVGPGLDILGAAMLLGRLVPLGILWWMASTTWEAELAVG
ncbi:MAG: hypothetical protein NTU53_10050 [Planctomycetota bacterium]|nr:hypothetical protein [Planctomycetota bacterium]